MHVVGAQLASFRLLAVTGGKSMNFAPPFVGELKRHVSQSTDANDSHPRGRGYVVDQERREHRDPAAEQRSHLCQVQPLRQRADPCPLCSNAVGKTTVAAHNGSLRVRAEMLIPGQAFMASQAAVSRPAKPHTLS